MNKRVRRAYAKRMPGQKYMVPQPSAIKAIREHLHKRFPGMDVKTAGHIASEAVEAIRQTLMKYGAIWLREVGSLHVVFAKPRLYRYRGEAYWTTPKYKMIAHISDSFYLELLNRGGIGDGEREDKTGQGGGGDNI
ncbi:MAG TPA: hypothetical protein PKV93_07080 [Fervidobacterium sp.]|nr:hypothetical protein [Fervidobacterium sp.]